MAERDLAPPGYRNVQLEPARTGVGNPNDASTWISFNVMEEATSGSPGTAASRNVPAIIDKYTKEGASIFNPRTPTEKAAVINIINKEREKRELKPITEELFDYNNDKFFQGIDARLAVMKEDRLRQDPYKELMQGWKEKYHGAKGQAKVRDAIEGSDSMFDIWTNGPKQYLKNKGVAFDSMLRDAIPGDQKDFVMAGDMIGALGSLALTKKIPGGAKMPKSLGQEVMEGMTGDAVRTVAGATSGAASGSLIYDLVNAGIRRTKGIADPQDAPTPALAAITEGRNTMMWTMGAAGLGPLAAATRPILGRYLFGLEGPAKQMSDIGEMYGAPLGISTAAQASTRGFGPTVGIARKYKNTLGKIPFFGGTGMKEKLTLASIQMSKAAKSTIKGYGDDIPMDEIEKFYKDSFKEFPSAVRKKMNKEAKDAGYKGWADMIEAEARVNELAPIEHMSDIGEFASKKAMERYQRFSYINNMLYEDFEKKAASISKPFIPTKNARMVGENLRNTIEAMRFRLRSGDQFEPTLGEIDKFIVDKISNLPDYINASNVRGLQKEINMLFSEISGPLKKDQGGAALLGSLRKAITADMNDFANWSKELNPEELLIGESAKKSLLRANDTFAKMAPLYKSPTAQTFKLVDQNMFQAGPEMPGFIYSDEIGKMLFRKGITPQRATDLHALIGNTAYKNGVQAWITDAFRNSLDKTATVAREVTMPNGTRQVVDVTEEIFNPDKFLRNVNFDDPGIKRMMDLAGESGDAFKSNVQQLATIQKRIVDQKIGGSTSQMIARRLSLGGIRSGLSMLTMGATPAMYGGGMAAGGIYTAVMTGLLARKTAAFLADPNSLKAWTRIVEPDASVGAQRAAMTQFLRTFLDREDVKSDVPKEYHSIGGVMKDPLGFLDWIYGSGYEGVVDAINDGSKRAYMDERYGENTDLNYQNVAQFKQDEDLYANVIRGVDSGTIPPSERANTVPVEEDTEVESIFTDNIAETQATPQLPNTGVVDAPLNPDQRIALAGGNLDEAIALGQRRI